MYKRTVASAPALNSHGCVGWNWQSSTPACISNPTPALHQRARVPVPPCPYAPPAPASRLTRTEVVLGLVAAQDLDRHDERVLHQVVVDHAMEDVDGRVVRAAGEERVPAVVGHLAHCLPVVPQHLVRLGREVRVEPAQPAVVRADDQVVAHRVHVQRRHPLDARLQLLRQLLPHQVVHAHVALRLFAGGARGTGRGEGWGLCRRYPRTARRGVPAGV